MTDTECMYMALDIAFSRMGITSPNPPVGAVIARNGDVISTGGTMPFGGDHAEVQAIKNACGIDLNGADIFVTLEPCSHQGKTPPCTEAIIKAGIKRVCILCVDPNPLVSGQGIQALRERGLEVVIMDKLVNSGEDLLRPFFKYITRHFPFIIHKSAFTLDGRTATDGSDSRWITGNSSRYLVHKIRSRVDAVIVGKHTFECDRPSLNVRFNDFPEDCRAENMTGDLHMNGYDNYFIKSLLKQQVHEYREPLRIVYGLPLTGLDNKKFFSNENYLFFVTQKEINDYRKSGISPDIPDKCLCVLSGETRDEQLNESCSIMFEKGIMFALLEGGASLAGSFFQSNLIDQYIYFIAPRVLGSGMPVIKSTETGMMSEARNLVSVTSVFVNEDIIISGYA